MSVARTRALSNQIPAGASVDKASDTITFTAHRASFTMVAVPPGGPGMTFRVAGLTDPVIVVPRDAQVTVQFINGDNDEAHGWLVTDEQPPVTQGMLNAALKTALGRSLHNLDDPGWGYDGALFGASRRIADRTFGDLTGWCPQPAPAAETLAGLLREHSA